jgi:hypothetical protein
MPKISLQEQLEELETEFVRRNREYPMLEACGEQRFEVGEIKIERLAAAINTIAYLVRHADMFKEYVLYATRALPPAQGGEWNEPKPNEEESAKAEAAE